MRHILVAGVNSQVRQQIAKEFPGVALCLEKEHSAGGLPQPLEQVEQQSSLAHARRRSQAQKSTAAFNNVKERRQCFAMHRAKVKIARIGRNPERLLTQAVVL